MLDESPKVEVANFNVGKLDYVDFLRVDTILSNSSNNTCEKVLFGRGGFLYHNKKGLLVFLCRSSWCVRKRRQNMRSLIHLRIASKIFRIIITVL
jgi:hypothetical protein